MATAQSILDRASDQLQDAGRVRWTEPELIEYLNDGLDTVSSFRPTAFMDTVQFTLIIGSSRQTVPGVTRITRVYRDGAVTPLRRVDFAQMDAYRGWMSSTTAPPRDYALSTVDPTVIWVAPRPDTAEVLSAEAAVPPTPVTAIGQAIAVIHDRYLPCLEDYVLYKAYLKDDDAASIARSQQHYRLFMQKLDATSVGDLDAKEIDGRRKGSSRLLNRTAGTAQEPQ